MPISFACPNGHKLSVPDEFAGKVAKCPRCASRVRIPAGDELVAAKGKPPARDAGASDPAPSAPHASTAPAAAPDADHMPLESFEPIDEPRPSSPPAVPVAATDRIEFLCPNGHYLTAPPEMVGEPGECPHCGSTFIVPDPRPAPTATPPTHEPVPSDAAPTATDADKRLAATVDFQTLGQISADMSVRETEGSGGIDLDDKVAPEMPPAADAHPMQTAATLLWEYRAQGATIEIRLRDGTRVTAEAFSRGLSETGCGVFGLREADGTYTLRAVPWADVAELTVKNVKDFTAGLFDSSEFGS